MIGIGSDHAGLEVKTLLIEYIKELGYQINDYGTYVNESVDYPDFAFKVGEAVSNKGIDKGILICKTGIGMSIACNKVEGIRCAKVDSVEEAKLTREHNDANVIAISAMKDIEEIKKIVYTFLTTEFSNDERHIRRVNKITEYEMKHEY